MKNMKKVLSLVLAQVFICIGASFAMPVSAQNAITLNTEDTNTVVDLAALGLSGTSYSVAQNESLSFQLIVPETEASKYITILRASNTGNLVKMDVVAANGAAVFSKTQQMRNVNELFSGVSGDTKDVDSAVMELAAGNYTVTLTNTSTTAFEFKSLEFRDVILPLGEEKTAFSITDAYYQYILYAHTSKYETSDAQKGNEVPEGVSKVVGGTPFYHMALQKGNNSVAKMYIMAETAGTYTIAARCWGWGTFVVSANGENAVTLASNIGKSKPVAVYTATTAINLVKGLNELVFTETQNASLGVNTIILELKEKAEEKPEITDYPDITLNTQDTNTLISVSDLGISDTSYVIGKNKKVGFDLTVPEGKGSKFITVLRGLSTGPVLKLEVTDGEGKSVYSKSQDMTLTSDTFSGVSGEGRDYDGAVMELPAGIYTFELTNTSDLGYSLESFEIRDVILPLGRELTAFHASDAYYQDMLWWHTARFTEPEPAPHGAVSVGGEAYYRIFMKKANTPDIRYYIYAEEAGAYRLSVRTRGGGGIVAKANNDASVTVIEPATEIYNSYRIDTCADIVYLHQGVNQISFSATGTITETAFDCFMLEKVESVWADENALSVSAVGDTYITVSWEAASLDNVSSWEIYQNGVKISDAAKETTSYTYGGLSSATSYELAVKAILADGTNYDTERKLTAYTGSFPARENLFVSLSAGRSHFIGINKNGKLQSFGSDNHGQSSTDLTEDLKTVTAGASSSYAIDKDGNVYSWGSNFYGQLGLGTEELCVKSPAKIDGITNAVQIAAGKEHTLVLTAEGLVYAFGNNRFGQLGTGNMLDRMQENTPVLVSALSGKAIVKIAAGGDASYAVSADGTLYSWGANYMGQLGDGNDAIDNRDLPYAVTVPDYKVTEVAGGGSHTMALCYKDANNNNVCDSGEEKAVFGWGADSRAQLATGDLNKWVNKPMRIEELDGFDVTAIAAGDGHTLALTADGTVYAWGWNGKGQLGIGTAPYAYEPTRIYNIPKIKSVSAGYAYSIALAEDGRVYAWGENCARQVADSTQTYYNAPVITNLSLENISIADIAFTDASGQTEDLPANGGKYTVSARCYNDSTAFFDGTVHICVYQLTNGKPQLLSAVPVKLQLDGRKTAELTSEITLPEETENVVVKLFAWDNNVAPYSDAAIVK